MLRSEYEGKIDLAEIESQATTRLGMVQPTMDQTVYLNLAGRDRAVITEEESSNPFVLLGEAIRSGISSLMEYLS